MNQFRQRDSGKMFTESQLREEFPDVGLPAVLDIVTLDHYGYDPVLQSPAPAVTATQRAVLNGVEEDPHGNWIYAWEIQDLEPEVIAAQQAEAIARFRAGVLVSIQDRLDSFAATRHYGDARTSPTTSISTYIGSIVPRFAEEAAYFRDQRDLTWAKLYEIEGAVLKGERGMPASYEEIEAELPPLEWPTPDIEVA